MDVLPLHVGLQKAALTAIMIVAPFVTHVSSMLWAQLDDESHPLLFALDFLLIGSTLFLLVHATCSGRSTAQAMENLSEFKLSNAECFLEEDRQTIEALIVRWFADGPHSESHMHRAIGIHNFERFVRMDVRAKAQKALGDLRRQWGGDHTLLLFLGTAGKHTHTHEHTHKHKHTHEHEHEHTYSKHVSRRHEASTPTQVASSSTKLPCRS